MLLRQDVGFLKRWRNTGAGCLKKRTFSIALNRLQQKMKEKKSACRRKRFWKRVFFNLPFQMKTNENAHLLTGV